MVRTAAGARARASREWVRSHVRPERRYRPPAERVLRRQHLRRVSESLASRYYQLLAGHAAIGFYFHEWAGVAEPSECW